MTIKNWRALAALMLALALVAAACGDDDDAGGGDNGGSGEDITAAFIMVAPVGDAGWNFMHNEARKAAEAATGVETTFVEAVPEGGADFDNAVRLPGSDAQVRR
jgi:basic membrane protein A